MSSPHPLDMPAAAPTGGCGPSPPNFPQRLRHCTASSTPPQPLQLSRFPRYRSAPPQLAIATAAPRSSRNCPPSPRPPKAAATTLCTRLGFVSTVWSPVASSPATRSRPASSAPQKPPGSWSRSQRRPAAPSPPSSGRGEPIPAASQPSTSRVARYQAEAPAGRQEVVRIASGMGDPSQSSPADRTRPPVLGCSLGLFTDMRLIFTLVYPVSNPTGSNGGHLDP